MFFMVAIVTARNVNIKFNDHEAHEEHEENQPFGHLNIAKQSPFCPCVCLWLIKKCSFIQAAPLAKKTASIIEKETSGIS